jgi:enamine deaminase RidA (YjgF/YER057c/UK114 family)
VYLLRTAGQVGTPPSITPTAPIPLSFREQAENAFSNVATCLALGGATPRDITKITIYVVNYELSLRDILVDVIAAFFSTNDGEKPHAPPSTLLGVAALASKEFLIEVEAEAAITASK